MGPRPLGRSGLFVSPVGLGTVKLGRNTGVKYPEPFELPSDEQVAALLDRALKLGINFIDTAPAYGTSEARLAPWASKFVVCTKAGESYDGRSVFDFTPGAVLASAAGSMRRLQVLRLDLLLLHSDGRDVENLRAALPALQRLKAEGKVRAIGISAKTQEGILEAIESLDVVMAPFGPADRTRGAALQMAHDAGLGVVAIKALDGGRAADPADAIRFVLARKFVDCVVVGTLSPDHLETAVRATEGAK